MIIKRSDILVAALFSMAALLAPKPAIATTRVVVQNSTQCPADIVTTPCYLNLSDAITQAVAGDSIEIKSGTYPGPFTINQNITSISGDETAGTFLTSNGSGAALTISGVSASISIRRLTFANSQTGILVRNAPSVTITDNIFQVGANNTAVQVTNSPNTTITNNAFFQNANGISSDQIAVNIVNNIFSSQFTAAISSNVAVTGILSNLFFNCTSIGPTISFDSTDTANYKGNLQNQDPLFVNVSSSDFHLQAGSPCINTGNTSPGLNIIGDPAKTDMGAYGGPTSDIVPFPVFGLISATSASASISLRWQPNNSYAVSGYRVYYGSTSGNRTGIGATEGASGFNVTMASATLSGLTTTVATPATPTLSPPQSLNESLVLNWSAVPSAKRYNVYYGTTSPPSTLAGTVDTPFFTLTGLTNGQTYFVAVSAVNQAIYYVTATAFDSAGTSTTNATPGVAHESAYSGEISVSIGSAVEGPLSNIVSEFPETLSPYPALPGGHQGCFIATAAYGHYSDPEVQALREFRDQYLLTNGLGRAFVGWYYQYSPAAAAALNAHPALKPVIRAALLPAVGGAWLLTRTSLLFKIGLLMVFGCVVLLLYNRKGFSRFGGDC